MASAVATLPDVRASLPSMPEAGPNPYIKSSVHMHGHVHVKPGAGKSSHLSTLKSLGLVNDLQEYIANMELLAVEQRHELERVREEKRVLQQMLHKHEVQAENHPGAGEWLQTTDLPPKLRAILEDNKGLKEKVKKLRASTISLEGLLSQKEAKLLSVTEANAKLKNQLSDCSRTPQDVQQEAGLKEQLRQKDELITNLQNQLRVLKHKSDTDAKTYRNNLAAAGRDKDAVKRQVVLAHVELEEKDRLHRSALLEIRALKRQMVPTRQSMGQPGSYQDLTATGEQDAPSASSISSTMHPPNAAASPACTSNPAAPPLVEEFSMAPLGWATADEQDVQEPSSTGEAAAGEGIELAQVAAATGSDFDGGVRSASSTVAEAAPIADAAQEAEQVPLTSESNEAASAEGVDTTGPADTAGAAAEAAAVEEGVPEATEPGVAAAVADGGEEGAGVSGEEPTALVEGVAADGAEGAVAEPAVDEEAEARRQEAAVIKIQAGARGMLARKAVARKKVDEGEACKALADPTPSSPPAGERLSHQSPPRSIPANRKSTTNAANKASKPTATAAPKGPPPSSVAQPPARRSIQAVISPASQKPAAAKGKGAAVKK